MLLSAIIRQAKGGTVVLVRRVLMGLMPEIMEQMAVKVDGVVTAVKAVGSIT
jgi:hypothetical protein